MKILLTGATGFVGIHIGRRLIRDGHELVALSRNPEAASEKLPFPCRVWKWDSTVSHLPPEVFEGVDAVIHLAGEPVAGHRWTESYKTKIYESRILGSRHLVSALGQIHGGRPRILISASAIGYYGNHRDSELSESSPPGHDFLADVCKGWEAEVLVPASLSEMRRVCVRIGIVLGLEGGALPELVEVFRKGLGGPAGSGRQWMSWIHIEDLVEVFVSALQEDSISGVVNAVAPQPVINLEFSKTLGKILNRSSQMRTPALALKLALGGMSSLILNSQRVITNVIPPNLFKFPTLEETLTNLLTSTAALKKNESEFLAEQWVGKPIEEVFHFFSESRNLEILTPPWLKFKIIRQSTPTLAKGTVIDYRLKIHGMPVKWKTLIDEWVPGSRFVDVQLKGPYRRWHHTHHFEKLRQGTLIRDRVIYEIPGGRLGRGVLAGKIRRDLQAIFAFRRKAMREIFR